MVVKGGMNDHEILPMARHFRGSPYILRFIEYMDVGASNGWKMDEVVPSSEVVAASAPRCRWNRWPPTTAARPQRAGATPTAAARSA
jgi:molybdenum cofactor biosynthesis enzyme MoaA